ncbi:fasciclin domain-containing protein [Pedobacter sp. P351]|uniref:fasciclin domain-containing protein n=1 Tax=Pedobacter superstes TaxID=3133441 RepID=UPI0030B428B3
MLRYLKRRFFSSPLWAVVLFSSVLLYGCKDGFDDYWDNGKPKGGYLYNKLKDNPEFSIFVEGLERTQIDQFVNKGGLYTVFAPTNEAFQNFFTTRGYTSISDVPPDELFEILSFHIVNNMWYYYDLKARYNSDAKSELYLTRNKKFVKIDVLTENTLKINDVAVINTLRDIDADNGVIHGIGQVLVPLPNLEQVLQKDPEFVNSTFYQLMQLTADSAYDSRNSFDRNRDGRIDSVFFKTYPFLSEVNTSLEYRANNAVSNQGGDPVYTTVLIPSNAVLNPFLAPALARVGNDITLLSPSYAEAVLESYFLSERKISAAELTARPVVLRTVNSEILPALPDSRFIRKNVEASNGIVHLINIIFPESDRLKSAVGKAMTDPDLSMFMAALQRAGVMGQWALTSKDGTFFAPTNAAFEAAGLDVEKRVLNGAQLTATQFNTIVRHHLINSNLNQAALTGTRDSDLGNTQQLVFATSNGATTVRSQGGVVATVQIPALIVGPASKGYVYKVDKVLLPFQ